MKDYILTNGKKGEVETDYGEVINNDTLKKNLTDDQAEVALSEVRAALTEDAHGRKRTTSGQEEYDNLEILSENVYGEENGEDSNLESLPEEAFQYQFEHG